MIHVLVTGATGFLGQHVVRELERRELLQVFWRGNVQVLPEGIIHLAAQCGGIGLNQVDPVGMLKINAQIMNDLFWIFNECHRAPKVVLIGSVCAYPKDCPVPFKESDLWSGYPEETNAAYGIAKRLLLETGQAYRQQYGSNIISVIPTNLYGPGDHFEEDRSHVIPALIKKFVEAKEEGLPSVTIWGTGKPTRDFLHVRDAAKAIVDALEHYDSPEPVNIGSGREVSILELAKMIQGIVGFEGELIFDTSKPDGQPRRCLDCSRAKAAWGFEPSIGLEEGLTETVEWYMANRVAA